MYTTFFDMCSGGGEKTAYSVIIIQGAEEEAVARFRDEFERDPYNTTCDCCGPDYSIWVHDTREEALQAYEGQTHYVVEDEPVTPQHPRSAAPHPTDEERN